MQYHNDTIIKTQEDFFNKIFTSHFIARVRKGYSRFTCERELETEQKLQYFDPPLLWLSALCLSRSPDAQPEALRPTLLGDGFFLLHLSNFSGPQTPSGFPRAPSAGRGFLYHISSTSLSTSTATPTLLTSVLTELYNSSTPTRSPTRSLKSHVWSSSSGNNCHAVHRSVSSGASVYECTMGIFYLVPFHQPISAHTISSHNCH